MTNDNIQELLNLNFQSRSHSELLTIKDYFKSLLSRLWADGESFSGKRPFGNSGWEYDLYRPLIKAGAVNGKLDEFDDIEEVDKKAADKLIFKLISGC